MAKRGPSLTALLGLLAVAGYQNRDKLSDLVNKAQADGSNPKVSSQFGDQIKTLMGGSPLGAALTSTISELMEMFQGTPQEKPAKTWVARGENETVAPDDLAQVIGEETLDDLALKTGMTRAEVLSALSDKLPGAIDAMTPHGRMPSADEAGGYV